MSDDQLSTELDFDTEALPEQDSFDPLPKGWYPTLIEAVNVKATKPDSNGHSKGKRLNLTHVVTEGEFKGRKIFNGINIVHENPVAQDIGRKQLGSVLAALGMKGERDMANLVQKELRVRVKISDQPGFDPKNEVNGYEPIGGAVKNSAPGSSVLAGPPSTGAKKKPAFIKS